MITFPGNKSIFTDTIDRIQISDLRLAVFMTHAALELPLPCKNLISNLHDHLDLNEESNLGLHSPCLGTERERRANKKQKYERRTRMSLTRLLLEIL